MTGKIKRKSIKSRTFQLKRQQKKTEIVTRKRKRIIITLLKTRASMRKMEHNETLNIQCVCVHFVSEGRVNFHWKSIYQRSYRIKENTNIKPEPNIKKLALVHMFTHSVLYFHRVRRVGRNMKCYYHNINQKHFIYWNWKIKVWKANNFKLYQWHQSIDGMVCIEQFSLLPFFRLPLPIFHLYICSLDLASVSELAISCEFFFEFIFLFDEWLPMAWWLVLLYFSCVCSFILFYDIRNSMYCPIPFGLYMVLFGTLS